MVLKDWKKTESKNKKPYDEDFFIQWKKGDKELEITPYFDNSKFKYFELWLREGDEGETIGTSKYASALILKAKDYMRSK